MRLLLMLLPICTTLATAQGWEWQNPLPQGNSLIGVQAIDGNNIISVGELGTVIKSVDGGTQWTVMSYTAGVTTQVTDVSFVDPNIGTAVGWNGTISRTTDGGVTWNLQSSGTTVNLLAVDFSDANIGTAVGGSPTVILRTTDGGLNWLPQTTSTTKALQEVSFATSDLGLIVGGSPGEAGVVLRTTNGGVTWTEQTTGTTQWLSGVDFIDPNTAVIVGGGGTIFRSTNGGVTWLVQTSGATDSFTGVSFSSTSLGVAVNNGKMYRTTNGGTTWSSTFLNTGGLSLAKVSLHSSGRGVVVGEYGIIFRTGNSGATWFLASNEATFYAVEGIDFADENVGVSAIGQAILRTTNGGASWTKMTLESTPYDVAFADGSVGVLVGGSGLEGVAWRTTNAGVSWISQSPSNSGLGRVDFANSTTGSVLAGGGVVLRTTDAGLTWTSQQTGATMALQGLFLIDANTGVIVGGGYEPSGSLILRTTNGGTNWTEQTSPTSQYLFAVSFANQSIGVAVGAFGTIIRTTDGGITWTNQVSGTTSFLEDVAFDASGTVGIAVGWNGTVLRTTDFGITWIPEQVGTIRDFFAVASLKQGGMVIGGSGGSILYNPLTSVLPAIAQFGVSYGSTGSAEPNNPGALITLDPVTGAGTLVGPTGIIGDDGSSVRALAIKSTGEIYALSYAASSDLYTVNASTGAATYVANTGLLHPGDMVFDASDVLYAVDETNILYTIDPVTGVRIVVGATGVTLNGLAYDPTTGTVYGSDNNDGIYTIDVTTGAATLVGTTGLGGNTPDILFDQAGNLFGVKSGVGGISNYISIDKTTGAGTVIGPTGFVAVVGLASRVLSTPPTIPCTDITNMAARCIGGGVKTIQVRVNLLNSTIHAGDNITIAIDESQYTSTIITNGTHSRANFSVPGWSVGDHIVSLVDEPGCLPDVHPTCVASDGIAKADPYWDDDAEWMVSAQEVPQATTLLGNYPNPFNPSSNIQYALSEDAYVTLRVYNMLGQVVASLVDEPQTAGYKSVVWDGRNESGASVASGIYIYRMTAGSFTATKRMLLLK